MKPAGESRSSDLKRLLQQALYDEFVAEKQYLIDSENYLECDQHGITEWCKNSHLNKKVAAELKVHAMEERNHVDLIMKLLYSYGERLIGLPDLPRVPIGDNKTQILYGNLHDELKAVYDYKLMLVCISEERGTKTYKIIQSILSDEEEHVRDIFEFIRKRFETFERYDDNITRPLKFKLDMGDKLEMIRLGNETVFETFEQLNLDLIFIGENAFVNSRVSKNDSLKKILTFITKQGFSWIFEKVLTDVGVEFPMYDLVAPKPQKNDKAIVEVMLEQIEHAIVKVRNILVITKDRTFLFKVFLLVLGFCEENKRLLNNIFEL
jgi:bacterioferritin (cytochrome b1)